MLKGHVFSKQIFGHPIFALFINTFLNGENGISDNYKNGMAITYNNSTLTVQSGAVCIQGRFLEEDSSTDIPAGTDNSYCKLIIEIDLDKQNTDSEFVQGSYKIVKSSSSYPNLIQTNIVKNTSGIYQYELARFRTTSSGITDFTDMRTFLNFDSIYYAIQTEYRAILEQLKQELASVEDGSAYVLKNNIVVLRGIKQLQASSSAGEYVDTAWQIDYPTGFNKDNTIVLAYQGSLNDNYEGAYGVNPFVSGAQLTASIPRCISLKTDKISVHAFHSSNNTQEYKYKIVLMKIPEYIEGVDYILGDVNEDGIIDNNDVQLVQNYIVGTEPYLTEKQYRAADVNKDGEITTRDASLIEDMISKS